MNLFNWTQKWWMRVSLIYAVLLILSLFDVGSFRIEPKEPKEEQPVITTKPSPYRGSQEPVEKEDPALTTKKLKKELDDKAKGEEKAKYERELKLMTPYEQTKELNSAKEAENMPAAERLVKRAPHFVRKYEKEYIPEWLYIVFLVGWVANGLAIVDWVGKKCGFKGFVKLSDHH